MIKNKNKSIKNIKFLAFALIVSFVIANFFIIQETFLLASEEDSHNHNHVGGDEEEITELSDAIGDKRKKIDVLQKEIDAYSAQIKEKQREARGLRNQISIIDNQLAKVSLDIESTEVKIEQTNLEIQSLNLEINTVEKEIDKQKENIAEYLRLMNKMDQISYLEVLLVNESFSDFFDQIKYTQDINSDLKDNVDNLKVLTRDLNLQKGNLEAKAELEEELKNELQERKGELGDKTVAQGILLAQAKLTENEYRNYSYQLQVEQQAVNSDILTLEKEVRKKLEDREAAEKFAGFGPARLSWPIDPSRGITAYFHDPDYPFRYLFEHPAIDIRAYHGTPLKAPESGYVARVKFDGSTNYGYVMLIHNGGLSTVFGHISNPLVKEDQYVSKGQTVALSGGTPGTPGSGRLSTGAHLHFEVRSNGIPVNPLEYLPKF